MTVDRIALAGLLHDIGKFAQRGTAQVGRSWDDETRKEFKYQHALHTWHFIEKHVPKDFSVSVLAAYHHRPKNADQMRIRLADQLSAGERDSGQGRDDSDRKAHPKQLHPIFTQVKLAEGAHPNPNGLYLPLKPLALEREVIFPAEKPLGTDDWQAYENMWAAFCKEAEGLKSLPLEAYLEAMQALLQRYTWCVPSAYFNAIPDVSLYDHSRMTAALAVCLSDFDDDKIEALNRDWQAGRGELWDEPVALLVGGDISGVQDFIYTISSKGAAKALRGRSFYLQLLTEAVLRFVLRELGLPYTNVIYSGGGHFFLLAPLSAQEKLSAIQAAISRKLLTHHGTALYLALGSAAVPLSGFQLGAFPQHWDAMHKDLQAAKSRRYTELGAAMHALVFSVPADGGGDKHCAVCGADDVRLSKWKEESEAEAQMICSQCRSYVEKLGADLPKAVGLHWHWIEPQDTARSTFAAALKAFGIEIRLVKKDDKIEAAPGDTLWAFDDPKNGWPQGSETTARWLRYTVNQIPVDGNQPVTFDKLQEKCKSGFKRLGVVRMDVDNLGDVFKEGLGNKATLSRLSALSSAMSLYFEGWVKRIIARDGREALVYAVYAGGDDVFLLGPWDVMPDVALDIANEFGNYTGDHPGLHISGGMAFIGGKYPVYQAAEDAGEAEGLAKARKIEKDGKVIEEKNAFAFLNTAWRWDAFKQVKEKQERLHDLVQGPEEASGSPKSILLLLRSLAKMESEAARGQKRPVWGRWMWMAAYHLTRAAERNEKKNPELRKELLAMREAFEQNQYGDLPQWGAATRWAQLLTRKK
ncbi:MAG: type III-A CRISPR-associated protein Cas10/Csm1 [Anaerolineales bacterium]